MAPAAVPIKFRREMPLDSVFRRFFMLIPFPDDAPLHKSFYPYVSRSLRIDIESYYMKKAHPVNRGFSLSGWFLSF
jgi:hypothetical protein